MFERLRNWAYFNPALAFALGSTIFVVAAMPLLWFMRPAPHSHAGFVTAEVLVTDTIATPETEFLRTRFQMRLPDGQIVQLSSTDAALVQTVTQTACLERRRADSGEFHYRLAQPRHCAT